jgi:hypothetical protein
MILAMTGMAAPQRGRIGSCGMWSCAGTPTTRLIA